MIFHYHRVLISYPLGDPWQKETTWSEFVWCDIEQDNDARIHIRVPQTGVMPSTEPYKELAGFECAKIRVIDLSKGEPVYYCLSLTDTLRRFDFSSYKVLLPRGKKWTPEDSSDIWSDTDTIQNKSMRGDEDYKALSLAYSSGNIPMHDDTETWLLPILEAHQVENHQMQQASMREQARIEEQEAVAKLHTIWLTNQRQQPITFEEYSDLNGRLNPKQRKAIQIHLENRLGYIKSVSNSEDDYANALYNILNRQGYAGILECNGDEAMTATNNVAQNHELQLAVREFLDRFLYPATLNTLYPNFYAGDTRERAAQPVRQDVHNYILDLVFYELKKYQPQYIDQPFQLEACPNAYAGQRLDVAPARNNRSSKQSNQGTTIAHSNNSHLADTPIQALIENRKTIQETLLDEQVLTNPSLKSEILTFLINDANRLTQMTELLELFECLELDEIADTTTQLPDYKLLCCARGNSTLTQLFKKYPVLLLSFKERFPRNPSIQLSILDATIQTINPKYQQIMTQAKQVLHELKGLQRGNPSSELARILRLTIQILESKPGENRVALLEQYTMLANTIVRNHPSQCWKKLGIAMAILGGLIAAIGGGVLIVGIATTTTAGILISGGSVACTVGLLGFFHHRAKTQVLHNFIESIKETKSPLLSS